MTKRQLVDDTVREETQTDVEMKVVTRCPSKYLLVDTETGTVYVGQDHQGAKLHWKKLLKSGALVRSILDRLDKA